METVRCEKHNFIHFRDEDCPACEEENPPCIVVCPHVEALRKRVEELEKEMDELKSVNKRIRLAQVYEQVRTDRLEHENLKADRYRKTLEEIRDDYGECAWTITGTSCENEKKNDADHRACFYCRAVEALKEVE